jgi:hypothetical protein
MGTTTARYRIITSLVIVAEAAILTAVVPQLVTLGQAMLRVAQTALGT